MPTPNELRAYLIVLREADVSFRRLRIGDVEIETDTPAGGDQAAALAEAAVAELTGADEGGDPRLDLRKRIFARDKG